MNSTKQQGAVLVVALVFMLLTAMIAATISQTAILEVTMAGNEQFNEEAFQRVHAITNAVATEDTNFVVTGKVGYRICDVSETDCDSNSISLPTEVTDVATGVELDYYVERQAPLFSPMPFRVGEGNASSSSNYNVAMFEVNADYDGTDVNLGQSRVAQGVAVRVANAGSQ